MISCSMYMHMIDCINLLQAFAQMFHVLSLMNDFAVVERWLCLYIMYIVHVFWLFTFINLFIFRTFQKTIIKMQLVSSFAVFYYYSRYAHLLKKSWQVNWRWMLKYSLQQKIIPLILVYIKSPLSSVDA